jgi:hypothetical protein
MRSLFALLGVLIAASVSMAGNCHGNAIVQTQAIVAQPVVVQTQAVAPVVAHVVVPSVQQFAVQQVVQPVVLQQVQHVQAVQHVQQVQFQNVQRVQAVNVGGGNRQFGLFNSSRGGGGNRQVGLINISR